MVNSPDFHSGDAGSSPVASTEEEPVKPKWEQWRVKYLGYNQRGMACAHVSMYVDPHEIERARDGVFEEIQRSVRERAFDRIQELSQERPGVICYISEEWQLVKI